VNKAYKTKRDWKIRSKQGDAAVRGETPQFGYADCKQNDLTLILVFIEKLINRIQ
jgi:hypothetical protein